MCVLSKREKGRSVPVRMGKESFQLRAEMPQCAQLKVRLAFVS